MKLDKKYIFPLLIYMIGLVYWYLFYFRGAPAIAHGDWVKEQVYLDTLRTSLEQFVIPWAWGKVFYFSSPLFMANPEWVFTPDILLLQVLTNQYFFYLHHCLFYSLGFFTLYKIAMQLRLQIPAYLFIFLIFNFNGYITGHISEGHFQWTGYYLIPTFLYLLYQSGSESAITARIVLAGGVLGLLFANGSFHIAIWLSLFVSFLYAFERRTWLKLFVILIVGYSLGAFRILPALIYFTSASTKGMQSGYTDISLLLNSLTQLRAHGFGATTLQGWWEYSLYIGFTGFFVLIIGVVMYLRSEFMQSRLTQQWVLAATLLFLLSLGNTWGVLETFHMPLGGIERLSTRFIIIPFLLCVVACTYAFNNLLNKLSNKTANLTSCILVGFVATDLFYQLLNWSLIATQMASGGSSLVPTIPIFLDVNVNFKLTVAIAWAVTGVAMIVSYVCLRNLNRQQSFKPIQKY
jgi:hypothetical protein